MVRLLANVLLLLGITVLPFWVIFVMILCLMFAFDFVEVIFYGVLFDVIYSTRELYFGTYTFAVCAALLYGIIFLIKPYIKL